MTAGAEHPQGTVYLLHFDQPYKHARHYTGWASDLTARLAEHAAGRGARLTQVVKEVGLSWQLARTWPGTRATERAIKDRRNAPRLCPVCSPHPQPGTGHHASPARAGDLAARREASAFLAGARSAETWAAPVIAAGRLDEARQMLALDYHPTGRQDAERQRGFTAQLAAMIRTADAGPAQARETEKEAGEDPAGKGTTLDTTEYDADGNAAESASGDADAAQYEHDPGSWLARDGDTVREVDADGTPGREASPDDGRPVAEAESDYAAEYTGEPGWTAADADNAYWRDREGEARTAEHGLQSARAGMDPFGFPVSPERAADQRAEAEGVRREYETERREREAVGVQGSRDREAEAG